MGEETAESCTIITTEANELVAPIHDRMPVILFPGDHEFWLDPTAWDAKRLKKMLRPHPAGPMRVYTVGMMVNNPANDSLACILPVA